MILTVFRPKRLKNGKIRIGRSYRGRYRLDGEHRITDIPLHTTDRRVAQQRIEQIVKEKQMEAVGLLAPHATRAASQTPLRRHLSDYVADLQAVGRDGQYIYELGNRVRRLMRECGWSQIKDVTSDSFQVWRAKQSLAPKTVNEYLTSITSLLNWMEKHERIERSPLRHVEKVRTNGKEARPRRAFARDEIPRLLAATGPRKVIYLTAVHTGLRRKELKLMETDDLHLDAEQPFVNVRPSTTKNHKQAVIALHPDVVAELRKLRWPLIGDHRDGSSCSSCCFPGWAEAGLLASPSLGGLVCNILLRRISHDPSQRDLLLSSNLFERFVQLRRKTDCRAHLHRALGFHLLFVSAFRLSIIAACPFSKRFTALHHIGTDKTSPQLQPSYEPMKVALWLPIAE